MGLRILRIRESVVLLKVALLLLLGLAVVVLILVVVLRLSVKEVVLIWSKSVRVEIRMRGLWPL
jgi:hypothetical protein